MFICCAFAAIGRQIAVRSKINSPAGTIMSLAAMLLVFALPVWGQGNSDYLNAMDKASGNKEQPLSEASSSNPGQINKFVESEASIEIESLLSTNYKEEYALYKKLDAARKAEVIDAFEATAGKAENVRVMKVINKIGLIGDGGGWNY